MCVSCGVPHGREPVQRGDVGVTRWQQPPKSSRTSALRIHRCLLCSPAHVQNVAIVTCS